MPAATRRPPRAEAETRRPPRAEAETRRPPGAEAETRRPPRADAAADDRLFKALADPTRRALLDRLRTHSGQTLSELCSGLAMTRQSATQHLDLLVAANLVATVRRGRERLHYLNPVPIGEVAHRWISQFDEPRLALLRAVKQRAEHAMTDEAVPSFVYVVYIEASPERVWEALTDADLSASYWGHANVSDWQVGSRWEHQRLDGSRVADCVGTVLESVPPCKLVTTWEDPHAPGQPPEPSRVTFTIEPFGGIVRLTVVHENLPDATNRDLAARGWAAVLSNLKSLLETGRVLSQRPWEMP